MLADGQATNLDRSNLSPNQFEYLGIERLKHSPYLTITPFPDSDFQACVLLAVAQTRDFRRLRRSITELNSVPQLLQLFVAEASGRLHQVGLGHLELRIGKQFPQIRIVRKNKEAAGVLIEPADVKYPRFHVLQQFVDGGATFWILARAEVIPWFVQQDVDTIARPQQSPIKRYAIALRIHPSVGVAGRLPVDANATVADPLGGNCTGTDSGTGENAIERFPPRFFIIALVAGRSSGRS